MVITETKSRLPEPNWRSFLITAQITAADREWLAAWRVVEAGWAYSDQRQIHLLRHGHYLGWMAGREGVK
jgi:hypothetical protein